MKIDIKSALAGLAIGIMAALAVAAGEGPTQGKYQATGGAGFFVIVNTETGQAWFANVASPGMTGIGPDFFGKKLDK